MGEFLFDFYELFVVNIFGSIFLSIFAVAAVIAIIFLICKVRPTFLTIWLIFYFVSMGALYLGGLALMMGWLVVSIMIIYQINRYFFEKRAG